jgi:hypothetical protein
VKKKESGTPDVKQGARVQIFVPPPCESVIDREKKEKAKSCSKVRVYFLAEGLGWTVKEP